MAEDTNALTQLRSLLLTNEPVALTLAPIAERDCFTAAALALATQHTIALNPVDLAPLFAPDPLGLSRFAAAPVQLGDAPPRHWLPTDITSGPDDPLIEWLHFAAEPLDRPFYQDSIQRVRALPFNRLMRCTTPLSALDSFADAPAPDGLIFHMSRCGSTLVAQMLGSLPASIAVSEPPPLDTVIQLAARGQVPPERVRQMIAALTRDRSDTPARHRFIKLDSWHILALPMLRALYPDTPWLFLHRDPVEVLVSQAQMPGVHAVPGLVPLDAFGIAPDPVRPHDAYLAWLLGLFCQAALDGLGDGLGKGGGIAIDYRDLPGAVRNCILPHFGIAPSAEDAAALDRAGQRDAKSPGSAFAPDTRAKQDAASPELRALAERHITAAQTRLRQTSA